MSVGALLLASACRDGGSDAGSDSGASESADAAETTAGDDLRAEFEAHYATWQTFLATPRIRRSSSLRPIVEHPDYLAMIAMGDHALALVMEKLAAGDFLMNDAAKQITGVDVWAGATLELDWSAGAPIYSAQDTTQRWLDWWTEHQSEPRWNP
ncbi:hypothetical protein ACNOYE_22505 [Nannocystaceae bacterium ST9]